MVMWQQCVGEGGRTGAQKKTELTIEQAVCIHCKSNHEVGANKCQRRIIEWKCEVERTRATNTISYAEATRRVREGNGTGRKEQDRPGTVEKQERKSDSGSLIMDRRMFLAFIAMVINCASEIETKSEKLWCTQLKRFWAFLMWRGMTYRGL